MPLELDLFRNSCTVVFQSPPKKIGISDFCFKISMKGSCHLGLQMDSRIRFLLGKILCSDKENQTFYSGPGDTIVNIFHAAKC